jgi:hypothetical protein
MMVQTNKAGAGTANSALFSSWAVLRCLIMVPLALSITGCGGCHGRGTLEMPDWEDLANEVANESYLQFLGPAAVTSAVGSATPPGGGPLNAVAMELAWRSLFDERTTQCDPVDVASAVGAATAPNPVVALLTLNALVGEDTPRAIVPNPIRLRSLFEQMQPHVPKRIRRELVW